MPLLRALPSESFDAREQATPRVDSKALVTVRQNRYSVPVCLVARKLLVKIGAREVEVTRSPGLESPADAVGVARAEPA